jgi:hypothetical protein
LALKDLNQTTAILKAVHVPSLSEHVLTDPEELVLKTELNFAVTNRESNLDMVPMAESLRSKLPPALGMEFCWKIGKKQRSYRLNQTPHARNERHPATCLW